MYKNIILQTSRISLKLTKRRIIKNRDDLLTLFLKDGNGGYEKAYYS